MASRSPSLARLLIRGDDAGVTRGNNEALLACARAGLVRNIGFMACAPAFAHAVELFREPLPGVVLGLHATVTCEWASSLRWGPVLPRDQVPTLLAADGCFVHATRTLHELADHDQIIAEVRAQIAKAKAAGLCLTYLDTHMIFNWLPGMQARLSALAAEEGLVMDEPHGNAVLPLAGDPLDTLFDRIAQLAPGATHLLITHPSTLDDDARLMVATSADDVEAVGRARAAETAFLTSPANIAWLRASPIDLITYADL